MFIRVLTHTFERKNKRITYSKTYKNRCLKKVLILSNAKMKANNVTTKEAI